MLERAQFDPLLTDKFFQILTGRRRRTKKVNFPLPSSERELDAFFASSKVKAYEKGVTVLIDGFMDWAAKHAIPTDYFPDFKNKLINRKKLHRLSEEGNRAIFRLIHDGLPLLVNIVDVLESQTLSIDTCKAVIQDVALELGKCEEGVFSHLVDAHLRLTADPEVMLQSAKKMLVQQVVINGISAYNKQFKNYDMYLMSGILNGNVVHYGNAILNLYGELLGIAAIEDNLAPMGGDEVSFLADYFEKHVHQELTLDNVLDYLFLQLNLPQFAEQLKNSQQIASTVRSFVDRLNQYGMDEAFNINDIFDQDALADDEYRLSIYASDYVYQSILYRLINLGFVDISKSVCHRLCGEDSVYRVKQRCLRYAFALTDQGRIPFIPYCLEKSAEGKLDVLLWLNSDQRKEEILAAVPDISTIIHFKKFADLLKFINWLPEETRIEFCLSYEAHKLRTLVNTKNKLEKLTQRMPKEIQMEFDKRFALRLYAGSQISNVDIQRYGLFAVRPNEEQQRQKAAKKHSCHIL